MRRFGRPEERVGHLLVLGGVGGAEIRTMTYDVAMPLFRVEESGGERHGLEGGGRLGAGELTNRCGSERNCFKEISVPARSQRAMARARRGDRRRPKPSADGGHSSRASAPGASRTAYGFCSDDVAQCPAVFAGFRFRGFLCVGRHRYRFGGQIGQGVDEL